jgi:hypothetical protein
LESLPLARLYLLTPRPSIPPITAKVIGGGRVDFCWIVIDRRHAGAPTWGWLKRDGPEDERPDAWNVGPDLTSSSNRPGKERSR